MHLGDVYYSRTQDEMQERFLMSAIRCSFIDAGAPFGNRDMYSGGEGNYWLVDQIGQGGSYFAIENSDWLFIAMDTGVHDYKQLHFGGGSKFLVPAARRSCSLRAILCSRRSMRSVARP
jgi:hypothetical protein